MSPLHELLDRFRQGAASEREKGNYFERLVKTYLLTEPYYADLYAGQVWLWQDWRAEAAKRGFGNIGADAGIDLVAETTTGELHAIQAKFYDEDAVLRLDDFATFFAASSKKHFGHRLIFLTATKSSGHLRNAVQDQQPPVSLITLFDLENSQIDWSRYQPDVAPKLKPKKTLRPHQQHAVDDVLAGLSKADRGKLIMACGTGKTFTSLKIAEQSAGSGKRVLFLVPSLALLSQSLTEWTQESAVPLHSFAVCSDSDVGKKRKSADDDFQMLSHELQYPATTDAKRLALEVAKRHDALHMSAVFSTYHSIDVISEAQQQHGLSDFDLIVCDEAHRTTGATFESDDESNFVKVHDATFIRGTKRVYMTATPRIYGDVAKASAEKDNVALCSMDDEALYGRQLHVITFSEAVRRGLLVDYKVIVLSIEEAHVNRRLQNLLKDENNQLKVDDAAKIVGCWKALAKQGLAESLAGDDSPMQRAVAFCQVIEVQKGAKTHKVSSKNIAGMFRAVVEEYQRTAEEESMATLACEAEHVDGGMNASEKEAKLSWLKQQPPADTCRILSNVRCLSEGVDVPALDAVLFLTPRNSQVDVVQSVGRVMRNAEGKKRGYVVLPVVIPAGMEPHEALNDNKTYKVVWQVLQALRSHDDRFDAMVNKMELVGPDVRKMEVVAITDKVQKKTAKATSKNKDAGRKSFSIGEPASPSYGKDAQGELQFEIGEIERAIYAKLVDKVGNRHHWEDWANDIAKIARTHIDRITALLEDSVNKREREAFEKFAAELRDDLNDSITDGEIIEMLAQHLITKPVFDALFEDYSFAKHNPMSQAMQGVLDALHEHRLEKETDTLQSFYDSVKLRAEGIDNAAGKQKIVVELYDKFFRNAFPRMTKRLGIVYTPVQVVDFIVHSIAHILESEFGQTLGSKGVHIVDPFTGTGTFITRLLQSGLIRQEELPHKYLREIHANEIVLLAYYIAAINIEAVYHGLVGNHYQPFEGICLTDTFQMHEKEDLVDALLVDNSNRRKRQKKLDIRVIFGNPPYSSGDKNDENNKNVSYPTLDARVSETYVRRSNRSMGKSKAYDSYIRAIRWATDRIGSTGVVGFVTGSGFIEKPALDGMRRCLADEHTKIYVLNLRGDIRKNILSKGAAKEGQNIFGGSSMTGISIVFLVKNPDSPVSGQILYFDVGDDVSRSDKLELLSTLGGIANPTIVWKTVTPDSHGDWLQQRNAQFEDFIGLGDKSGRGMNLFATFSMGIKTNRDEWTHNFSKRALLSNMDRMIAHYNAEVERFRRAESGVSDIASFVSRDKAKIKWTTDVLGDLERGKTSVLEPGSAVVTMYRPFSKVWVYSNKTWNWTRHLMPRMFPNNDVKNVVICVTGVGARSGFSALVSNCVPNLHLLDTGQCFPMYLYDGDRASYENGTQDGLFNQSPSAPSTQGRAALTDEGLSHFQAAYPDDSVSKEDVFYYVYGLLHSQDYRVLFADNLAKELPRIPCVKSAGDFWEFSRAGRALSELHLNYESAPVYAGAKIEFVGKPLTDADYGVEKMRYRKTGKDKDLTTILYNDRITVTGIPVEAYEYVVNGKPAIDWVMERQCVKTDKDSGIVSDANDWAVETMGNPRYPLELLLRVVTVSLETMKIVRALPPMVL